MFGNFTKSGGDLLLKADDQGQEQEKGEGNIEQVQPDNAMLQEIPDLEGQRTGNSAEGVEHPVENHIRRVISKADQAREKTKGWLAFDLGPQPPVEKPGQHLGERGGGVLHPG